jgi:predicted MPP superfamily phosphohydrolase
MNSQMSHLALPSGAGPARLLAATLGGLALAGGLLVSYASQIEPQWAEIVRVSLPLVRLPPSFEGLTIAHISDLHAGSTVGPLQIRRFVAMVNALHPDITVVTGDMFQGYPEEARMCAHELAALEAPLGVYLIMGNHERRLPPEEGEEPFRRPGLTVLCNASQEIRSNGSSLWILGADDILTRHGDLELTLEGVPEEACKILLAHEPDFADTSAQFPIDLQLSGHTHGGQIRLPGIGPLMLPILGRKYPMGLYHIQDMWLYTNRGLGMARPTVRFNCRPEITLFTLHTQDSGAGQGSSAGTEE